MLWQHQKEYNKDKIAEWKIIIVIHGHLFVVIILVENTIIIGLCCYWYDIERRQQQRNVWFETVAYKRSLKMK